ncbi:MAG: J domain-containing protein, partial [Campylobacterota bacterium]|nr:J domain-containing protein [Campylobacterota bacterium]
SESAYTVLGVSVDDDYKTSQKKYRALVKQFHPDLNRDRIKLATEITQKLNNAWETVEEWKK